MRVIVQIQAGPGEVDDPRAQARLEKALRKIAGNSVEKAEKAQEKALVPELQTEAAQDLLGAAVRYYELLTASMVGQIGAILEEEWR